MEVPLDVATVGWHGFGFGSAPPRARQCCPGGIDDRDQGYGAFRLRDLAPGDGAVELAEAALAFRVETVTRVPEPDLPAARSSSAQRPGSRWSRAAGPFDYGANGYRDNVVVVARPDVP